METEYDSTEDKCHICTSERYDYYFYFLANSNWLVIASGADVQWNEFANHKLYPLIWLHS